jgi:hypothetical protein
VPRWFLAGLGRSPRDESASIELDYVVSPHIALRRRHDEHLAECADPLPGRCLSQVVITVPARVLSGDDRGRLGKVAALTDIQRRQVVGAATEGSRVARCLLVKTGQQGRWRTAGDGETGSVGRLAFVIGLVVVHRAGDGRLWRTSSTDRRQFVADRNCHGWCRRGALWRMFRFVFGDGRRALTTRR